ncbi:transcriptional regulator, Spx/MgsR family [Blautia hydrogenotrophica DSM 10507]|uniref:Regulatory protein spx n=2 Tax=Blautia hydrogenotrophica TaxID=53443 RepID=C0CLU9_BLAHS|nr:transcriptional regulator, Spx/MgsR family [Blautia hydrogenotrophica DSM 10507]
MVSEFIIFNEEHLVKEKRRKDGTRNENVIESKELKRSENIRKKKGGIFMVLFLEYPKCSTCKKAKKWLEEHQVNYDDRHIVEDNPTVEELKDWIGRSGLPLRRFFNTSGMKYRELQLKDRLPKMSEEEQLELLATDGMLVKRPLLVLEDRVIPGFKEKEWLEGLGL